MPEISHPFEDTLNHTSCFEKPTHNPKVTDIHAVAQNCLKKETEDISAEYGNMQT